MNSVEWGKHYLSNNNVIQPMDSNHTLPIPKNLLEIRKLLSSAQDMSDVRRICICQGPTILDNHNLPFSVPTNYFFCCPKRASHEEGISRNYTHNTIYKKTKCYPGPSNKQLFIRDMLKSYENTYVLSGDHDRRMMVSVDW